MTQTTASLSQHPTLAGALDWLEAAAHLDIRSRRNMISSIRTLCRVLDREPRHISIVPAELRQVLATASPGVIGLSRSRWANVKSDVRRAVRLSGSAPKRAEPVSLGADWEQLLALEPHVCRRSALRRFGRFCSPRQIAPAAVSDEVVQDYFQYLDESGLCKTPERITRDLIRFWNKLADLRDMDLQGLSRRGGREIYTLSWDELPEGLARDAAAFRESRLSPCPFDDAASPVRPATADQQDRMLRRLASATLRHGVSTERLQSLRDLVRPENVKAGLTFLLQRHDTETSAHVSDMTNLVLTVARRLEIPEAEIRQLKIWSRRLSHRPKGMTPRNRARLRGLIGPEALPRLLALPDELMRQAEAQRKSFRSAILMQKAVAIGILLVAPLRLKNLVMLDRAVHFQRSLSPGEAGWELYYQALDVKNAVDLHLPLPSWLMTIIDRYMRDYQPILARKPGSHLFPGRNGIKTGSSLRGLLQRVIRRELGLEIHPHLFRHLGALLFLRAHPGQYETVRQLLGHKSLQTTYEHYACFEQDMAGRMYNEVIANHRLGSDPGHNSPRKKARRQQRSAASHQTHHGFASR